MTMRKKPEPLTKADFIEFAHNMSASVETLRNDFGSMKVEMTSRFEKVDLDIRRLMSASLATNDRMTSMEERLTRKMDDLESRVNTKLDAASTRMETLWRETTLYPPILDKQGARLEDHERRIKALEAN